DPLCLASHEPMGGKPPEGAQRRRRGSRAVGSGTRADTTSSRHPAVRLVPRHSILLQGYVSLLFGAAQGRGGMVQPRLGDEDRYRGELSEAHRLLTEMGATRRASRLERQLGLFSEKQR